MNIPGGPFFLSLSLATALLAVVAHAEAPPPVVAGFSPQGVVKQPQQVIARFSTAMVPFGDLRDVAPPFTKDCEAKGASRWIDATTWAFDFEKPLPGGVRCTFTMAAGLKAHDGRPIEGTRAFSFSTGGPSVVAVVPESGSYGVDENQVFVLGLDAATSWADAREHVGFYVDGLPERIEADEVPAPDRDAIVASLGKWRRPEPPLLAIRPRRTFPNGRNVRLEWGEGIRAASGEATAAAQSFEFRVRDAFGVDVSCRRENARADCVPIQPVVVRFTASIAGDAARAIRLVGPDGKEIAPSNVGWDEDDATAPFADRVAFDGPFAERATYTLRLPPDLRDDAGRALPAGQATSIPVKTAAMPVLAKFAAGFGIVERNAEPALPITLRNIEPVVAGREAVPVPPRSPGLSAAAAAKLTGKDLRVASADPAAILGWLARVARTNRRHSIFTAKEATPKAKPRAFTLPKPLPTRETEVVGLPMTGPGLHVVEVESPMLGAALLGQKRSMFVQAAVLVTNLSVHFKQGRESSLAWVTTLDRAEPVAGARVAVTDCKGQELAHAATDADGVARFGPLPSSEKLPSCWPASRGGDEDDWADVETVDSLASLATGLFVVATTGDDMTFVHSSWDKGIEPWRFQVDASFGYGPRDTRAVATVFDRPLYRAGDTVHMKHVLRDRSMAGFALPPAAGRPTKLVIDHDRDQSWTVDVAFDDSGVATTDWKIPEGARLGLYRVRYGDSASVLDGGTFRVEQFRVPLVRGEVSAPPSIEPRATSVPVDLSVRYLAGGGASGLPVLLRGELRPATFPAPDGFEEFSFESGRIKEGIVTPGEDSYDDEGEAAAVEPSAGGPRALARHDAVLDAAGTARVEVGDLPAVDAATDLVLEAEFRDPDGETENVATTRLLLPSSRMPGLAIDRWADTGKRLHPRVAVVTPDGRPAPGTAVRIEVASRRWLSTRKRLVGGFYDYGNASETKRLGLLCEGTTDAHGLFECDAEAPARGELLLEATVSDDRGRPASTVASAWVGGEDSGFESRAGDRMDLVPEKRSYEPGETARLQVRMPMREATALVTVEREGVGEPRVVHLEGEHPVVEVPFRDEHAPNVFVSVLAVRGRVADVQPTAMLDLGRPAFKLGLVELKVDWKSHRLGVAVTSDREVYATRETAKAHVRVTSPDGSPLPEGAEVAVTAVDEGLLELASNPSLELLASMMSHRPYEVQTATAQGEVVGKRHYGRKAVAAGGGGGLGGASSTRQLFDTLLLWYPRVRLDARGEADVDVPLNDSLTSFRIVAVATAGAGLFGTGATTIRATRDLQLLSGLPLLVREGDDLEAEFTIRNTGDGPVDVDVSGSASPASGAAVALAAQRAALAAGQARTLTWPVHVPAGTGSLRYAMQAVAAGTAGDRLEVTQQVVPAAVVRVVESTLAQLDGTSRLPVRAPAGSDTRAAGSGIVVEGSASMASATGPLVDWLRAYRYRCLEQRVSVAIGAGDDAAWQAIASELASYVDGDGLLRYFPGRLPGDDRLTSYVLSIAKAAGRAIPAPVEERMKAGLRGFVDGSIRRGTGLDLPDLTVRKLAAIDALARAGDTDPARIDGITVQPELWPTCSLLDWWDILARTPSLPDRDARTAAVEQVVKSRLDLSGTTLVFRDGADEDLWWMMASGDSNAARLLLHLVEQGLWKEDAPRILRGTLARRKGGAWQTTVANAWGVLAMKAFAKAFESEAVSGSTDVALAGQARTIEWTSPSPPGVSLPWPEGEAELAVEHRGSGRPWLTTTSKAALPATSPTWAGYRITRTVTPTEARTPGRWSRGDRVKVRLDIDAQRPMWWVVVDDPVPAGASHLATGLGRGAPPAGMSLDEWMKGEDEGRLEPDYAERSAASWRGYLRLVPEGHSFVEYSIRLNQAGRFLLPPTRVEALYAPEVFGELPNAPVEVQP